jgi:SAM-dependent methyltransferase
MEATVNRVEECRVCGSNDWLEVISLGDHELANGFLPQAEQYDEPTYPLDVIVCRNCWLMTIRHTVDPAALFHHYVYVSSESDLILGQMRHIVDVAVNRFGLNQGDLVVELGSNIGIHLGMFQDAGMRVTGVDPAKNLVAVANERGVESIADFFGPEPAGRIREAKGAARFMLGRQCFAHIDDVHNVLDGVTTVLAPDGVLAIEVPYLLPLLDEVQFDTIFHEHLSYFSFGTLVRLFASHGLRVVDVERAPVHGGSIVVYSTPTDADRVASDAVAELSALEQRRGLTTEEPYREFAERTQQVIDSLRDLVHDLVADGKRVAGYGAPSKGCALLQFSGLDWRDLEFLSDTTELKHGKVTPGTHIPVISPEQARENPPDYYLLLAWNYAPEIIRKEQAFLDGGGGFIVPIPQPRVVTADTQGGTLPGVNAA